MYEWDPQKDAIKRAIEDNTRAFEQAQRERNNYHSHTYQQHTPSKPLTPEEREALANLKKNIKTKIKSAWKNNSLLRKLCYFILIVWGIDLAFTLICKIIFLFVGQ